MPRARVPGPADQEHAGHRPLSAIVMRKETHPVEVATNGALTWAEWRRRLGRQVRRLREFIGLSQEQLAALAGVSQAAVSRLEAGRGLATPLLLLMKLYVPLAHALRGLDSSLLND